VQKKRAIALQQEWGSKPCPHPALAKEYDLGQRTGNYVCTQCGKTFTFKERAELLASRASAGESPNAN
jgi:transposase-like protein